MFQITGISFRNTLQFRHKSTWQTIPHKLSPHQHPYLGMVHSAKKYILRQRLHNKAPTGR